MGALCDDAARAGLEHPSLAPIAWLLEHGAPDQRIRCAALQTLRCPAMTGTEFIAAPIVVKCLEDPVPLVRDAASHTLGCLREDGVKEAAYALDHENELVKGLAARALGFAGPLASSHAQTLLPWLNTEKNSLR